MPPTVISLYIFARLDSFSYEQIQRGRGAHEHAYNLSLGIFRAGRICIYPLIRYRVCARPNRGGQR